VEIFSTPLGDGLLKAAITLIILVVAWILVRAVLKLAGRLAALGCLVVVFLGIVAAILWMRAG